MLGDGVYDFVAEGDLENVGVTLGESDIVVDGDMEARGVFEGEFEEV